MTKTIDIARDQVLSTYGKAKPRDYQVNCITELLSSLKENKDATLRLPTGMGKSFVYLPLAISAANQGYRVCILSATNFLIDQLKHEYLPKFKKSVRPVDIRGLVHYDCLISGRKADFVFCAEEQSRPDRTMTCTCDINRANFEKSVFVLSNFHKFLRTPLKNKFDLVIIDDSHGFENAADDNFQTQINYFRVEELYQKHQPSKDELSDLAGKFLDIFDDVLGSVPEGQLSRRVADDDVKRIGQVEEFVKVSQKLGQLDELDRELCRELLYFIKNCKDLTLNTFYVQKDFYNPEDHREGVLISKKSDQYIENVMRYIFGDTRVIFASAFLEDAVSHASYCTRRPYAEDSLRIVPEKKPDIVKSWFKRLRIFEVTDLESSGDAFAEGVALMADILTKTKVKSLLLFKNFRDQRSAEKDLRKRVNRDITFVDDTFETEQVQELVKKADIIMASASSRLWEGIDIGKLKLEVIFSLPFIRPPVYMDTKKSYPYVRRKMLIRLQQGIGRLIREPAGLGVCVVLNYSRKPTAQSKLSSHASSHEFSPELKERIVQVRKKQVCMQVITALKGA